MFWNSTMMKKMDCYLRGIYPSIKWLLYLKATASKSFLFLCVCGYFEEI